MQLNFIDVNNVHISYVQYLFRPSTETALLSTLVEAIMMDH